MKRETRTKRAFLALGLSSALLLPAGCAASREWDRDRGLLHAELRLLEDVVYELEGEVKDKEVQINAAKRENELIKEELKALSDRRQKAANDEAFDVLPAAPGSRPLPDPRKPVDPRKPADMGTIEAPKVDAPALPFPPPFPADDQGSATPPPSSYRRAQYTEEEENQLAQGPTAPGEEAAGPTPRSAQQTQRSLLDSPWKAATVAPPSAVDHITIHPRLSGGHDTDHKSGHDGIQVIFAPRDASDQPLQVRGAISVVLVDPELQARSARWEYTLDESQQFFKKSLLAGEAYHLDLRWPLNPPQNSEQELHVRFTTADGQRHEASTKIILQLPGAKIAAPPQQPARRAEAPQHAAPQRVAGTPTLAPPQNMSNDPPPAWTGTDNGPSLTAPLMAAVPNYNAPKNNAPTNSPPAINITVPDVGGVPEIGKDNQRLTITQRLQQRRAARMRGQSSPSAAETGNLALPTVEAPALPGMSVPNLNVPNLNVPNLNMPGSAPAYPGPLNSVPAQPGALPQQPAKPSGWRSMFNNKPFSNSPMPTSAAPAYGTAPVAAGIPAALPDSFVIVPVGPAGSIAPLNNAPGVSPLPMLPPPQLTAPEYPNDASRTATKPEWKPYR